MLHLDLPPCEVTIPDEGSRLNAASPVGGGAGSCTGTHDHPDGCAGADHSSGAVKALESGLASGLQLVSKDRQPLPPRIDASLLEFYRKLTHIRRSVNAEVCLDRIRKPKRDNTFTQPSVIRATHMRTPTPIKNSTNSLGAAITDFSVHIIFITLLLSLTQGWRSGPVTYVADDAHDMWVYVTANGKVGVAINNGNEERILSTPWMGAELLLTTSDGTGVCGVHSIYGTRAERPSSCVFLRTKHVD